MQLTHLFIFRHGRYEGRGFLTPEGKEEITTLGATLRDRYGLIPAETAIICSMELRALKTAQCLITVAGLEELRDMCRQELFSDDRVCDTEAALEVIKKYADRFKKLIVITHNEMAGILPHEFGKKVLGTNAIYATIFGYGQGCVIDCERKSCDVVEY